MIGPQKTKPHCFQSGREDIFEIKDSSDLFICVSNGAHIRISIKPDGIEISPINGVNVSFGVTYGCPAIKFLAKEE